MKEDKPYKSQQLYIFNTYHLILKPQLQLLCLHSFGHKIQKRRVDYSYNHL